MGQFQFPKTRLTHDAEYGMIMAELHEMELAKFRWRTLAEALGIGLAIEILEGICVASLLPPQWANALGDLPLQPASYLVTLLAKADHLGFEGQVLYFLLAVVVQWLVYSAVVYLLLAISRKKRDATSGH